LRARGNWPVIPRGIITVVVARPKCLGHLPQSRSIDQFGREPDAPLVIAADYRISLDLNLMGFVGRKPDRPSRRLVAGSDDLQMGSVRQKRLYFPLGGPKPEMFHHLVGKVVATRRLVVASKRQTEKDAHIAVVGLPLPPFAI